MRHGRGFAGGCRPAARFALICSPPYRAPWRASRTGWRPACLVGVSPVHGLYASTAGPIAGGLTTSTELMLVTTTSAAALAAGSALAGTSAADRPGALTALTLMAEPLMIVAAALRAGRYTRFVSHSVMTGFLTGVAANIVLGQIPNLLGVSASGSINLAKAINALIPSRADRDRVAC